MRLTAQEPAILHAEEGPVVAEAIDHLIQFGDAFGAEPAVLRNERRTAVKGEEE